MLNNGKNKIFNKQNSEPSQAGEDKDLKSMMEENLRISKKIHRYIVWQRTFGIIKLLLIVVPIILGIIYLPPILQNLFSPYQELLDGAQNLNNVSGSLDINSLLK